MDVDTLLLLVAFRHRIREADIGAGLARVEAIIGRTLLDEGAARDALARAVARGDLRDPVRLPPGALQCHWHLEPTPQGVEAVRALLRGERGLSADELPKLIEEVASGALPPGGEQHRTGERERGRRDRAGPARRC